MKLRRLTNDVKSGCALKAQSISAGGTANGITISEPWNLGGGIRFSLIGGAIATNGALRVRLQGRRRSDNSTWDDLKDAGGTNAIAFTASKMVDAGTLETDGYLEGCVAFQDLDVETYNALRLAAAEIGGSGGGAVLVGASYDILNLQSKPSGSVDDLFLNVHNGT